MVHTVVFISAFAIGFLGFAEWDTVLLVLTTLVSLEAIYIAIFIQMTVNRHTKSLQGVEADIDDIEEDLKEIEADVDHIQEDIEDISEDEEQDALRKKNQGLLLDRITQDLEKLITEIDSLKSKK